MRAETCSILARLENVTSAESAGFSDVSDEWYATAVNWKDDPRALSRRINNSNTEQSQNAAALFVVCVEKFVLKRYNGSMNIQ